MNKRTKILAGVLGVMVAILVGQQVMERNGGGGQKQKLSQVQNVNRDHLRITSLYPLNHSLKSIGANPFTNVDEQRKQAATPPPTTPTSIQQPVPSEDTIPITPPVMQRPGSDSKPKADEKTPQMKLKAIAHSDNRSVAVVECNGKTTSVFVGGAVGEYIVTDISESQMTLQNFGGKVLTLTISQ